ncbi:hypothetical protein [Carnobacterium divergens]|uniref:hypothetical protein n=1 Tax=Carnobacterium divergens TaxID=2748 RepID=UPI00142FFE5F|nr:hypothetical protein [Carnobacterium divergens]MDT1995396.1 hypothetical protein [Carnobacterium divergens]
MFVTVILAAVLFSIGSRYYNAPAFLILLPVGLGYYKPLATKLRKYEQTKKASKEEIDE